MNTSHVRLLQLQEVLKAGGISVYATLRQRVCFWLAPWHTWACAGLSVGLANPAQCLSLLTASTLPTALVARLQSSGMAKPKPIYCLVLYKSGSTPALSSHWLMCSSLSPIPHYLMQLESKSIARQSKPQWRKIGHSLPSNSQTQTQKTSSSLLKSLLVNSFQCSIIQQKPDLSLWLLTRVKVTTKNPKPACSAPHWPLPAGWGAPGWSPLKSAAPVVPVLFFLGLGCVPDVASAPRAYSSLQSWVGQNPWNRWYPPWSLRCKETGGEILTHSIYW